MPPSLTLPSPDKAAHQHSLTVQEAIRAEINAAGGWISFARYMELALYAPALGYYSGGAAKFGSSGDFVTAPEISSLFGRTLARQTKQILESVKQADILEFGAGSGKLALDLLLELEQQGCLPQTYFILEVSADLRQRQLALIEKHASHLVSLLHWLDQLPTKFNGLILANEVLDAMPSHLIAWRNNHLYERGVIWEDETFKWYEQPLLEGALFELANELTPQINLNNAHDNHLYISEINLASRNFVRSMADTLQHGMMLLVDYGFGHNEYYHPQRNQGTLMCHYRHHVHDDPFYLPGLQDITCHVDFSAVLNATKNTEMELYGYTTQAHFLINCGITEILAQTPAQQVSQYLPQANQLQKLVSPAEMGELFKVIALGKNINMPLIGFTNGDKCHLL